MLRIVLVTFLLVASALNGSHTHAQLSPCTAGKDKSVSKKPAPRNDGRGPGGGNRGRPDNRRGGGGGPRGKPKPAEQAAKPAEAGQED
jgi:hypothetical protein